MRKPFVAILLVALFATSPLFSQTQAQIDGAQNRALKTMATGLKAADAKLAAEDARIDARIDSLIKVINALPKSLSRSQLLNMFVVDPDYAKKHNMSRKDGKPFVAEALRKADTTIATQAELNRQNIDSVNTWHNRDMVASKRFQDSVRVELAKLTNGYCKLDRRTAADSVRIDSLKYDVHSLQIVDQHHDENLRDVNAVLGDGPKSEKKEGQRNLKTLARSENPYTWLPARR